MVNEEKLVNIINHKLPNLLATPGNTVKTIRELSIGGAIADLVLISYPRNFQLSNIKVLNTSESVILATLRRIKRTRIDILENKCGLSRYSMRNGLLRRLLEWNLITKCKGGMIQINPDWGDNFKVIAIEAKLTDWRRAIIQANTYRKYADEVFVALPTLNAQKAKEELRVFEMHGIGLLTIDKNKINIELNSTTSTVYDWRRDYAVSRLIARGKVRNV